MSAKGYLVVEAKVTDPVAYETYKQLAAPAIAQYGGRYLRGGAAEVLEGPWTAPQRLVIVEFDRSNAPRNSTIRPNTGRHAKRVQERRT